MKMVENGLSFFGCQIFAVLNFKSEFRLILVMIIEEEYFI